MCLIKLTPNGTIVWCTKTELVSLTPHRWHVWHEPFSSINKMSQKNDNTHIKDLVFTSQLIICSHRSAHTRMLLWSRPLANKNSTCVKAANTKKCCKSHEKACRVTSLNNEKKTCLWIFLSHRFNHSCHRRQMFDKTVLPRVVWSTTWRTSSWSPRMCNTYVYTRQYLDCVAYNIRHSPWVLHPLREQQRRPFSRCHFFKLPETSPTLSFSINAMTKTKKKQSVRRKKMNSASLETNTTTTASLKRQQ